ncbi:neutrophil cytosol factor 2 protein [Colletotrichum truncatum]|uniref:Neutrophil cytosol factor 2 protein n=1 Tax=Colletotrichum truncatum TaxID=5467 RepID=A0ACC3YGT1_COLTU|nr:neutrophil cytosol factor 2 protein [Colletotrichum truncatum]KAF6784062.1 neutrophil cytosol factor 2 protein [Colletotrichum truncatum]
MVKSSLSPSQPFPPPFLDVFNLDMRAASFARGILPKIRIVRPNFNHQLLKSNLVPPTRPSAADVITPASISHTRKLTMSSAAEPQPQEAVAPKTEESTAPAQPELPPLSPAEFRVYNQMAEKMDYFHNHFRAQWTILHDAATSGKRPRNLTLKQFINTGLQFAQHLTAHHGIEERFVFPMLARKMPEFRGGRAELLQQHRQIHKGLDLFEDYLKKCASGETELELSVLLEKMDSWGEVLWTHLDQEVKTLGADNMRKYWTIDEVRNMPM